MLRRAYAATPTIADYERAVRVKNQAIRALIEENNQLKRLIAQMTRPATDPRLLRLDHERRN